MRPVLFLAGCVALAAQDFTVEKEAQLGSEMAAELERERPPVESLIVQMYVHEIGARIAAQMTSPFRFSFRALHNDQSKEAFGVPGGHVFVSSGLVLAAENESEFAGVLAQAMAPRPRTERPGTTGTIPLVYIGGLNGKMCATMIPTFALERRRVIELDADRTAAAVMSRAGFDPAALVRFIDREQRDHPRCPPDRLTRIASLQEAIRNLAPATYVESGDFNRVQLELRPPPEKPPTLHRAQ
jgi:beta-barrel assembly-enhancing protease